MFYLTTHSTHFIYGYMEGRKEMFYLTTHSTHFIYGYMEGRKEMFYLTTHSTHFIYGYMEGRKEMFYLTTHSTHFIYGYMASNIWLRTILIVRKETRCHHMGYSFRLAARVLLCALKVQVILQVLLTHWVRYKQTRFKKTPYLIRQANTVYKFSIKVYFSSTGQDRAKLQKQISNLQILFEMAAWLKWRKKMMT